MTLRIIFMGTPDFSVPSLCALHKSGHEIVACYSQPPRPGGRRGLELVASPVSKTAEQLGIPVYTPVSLKDASEQQLFRAHNADVGVVVAYGLVLPGPVLDGPRSGCFNGHASLLPRWRGAAPIQRAVMAGDRETGVMIMKMDTGLDTGPVAMETKVAIETYTTAGLLHDQLSIAGADLMVEAMDALERGTLVLEPQKETGVTYAVKISKSEARIDWSKPAIEVLCTIMGLSPFPGAWGKMRLGDKMPRVKILKAEMAVGDTGCRAGEVTSAASGRIEIACGTGSVRVLSLQRAGSKVMSAEEFLRGNTLTPGQILA